MVRILTKSMGSCGEPFRAVGMGTHLVSLNCRNRTVDAGLRSHFRTADIVYLLLAGRSSDIEADYAQTRQRTKSRSHGLRHRARAFTPINRSTRR